MVLSSQMHAKNSLNGIPSCRFFAPYEDLIPVALNSRDPSDMKDVVWYYTKLSGRLVEGWERWEPPTPTFGGQTSTVSSPLILRHHSLCRTSSPSSPPSKVQYFCKNHTLASQLRTSHGVPVEAHPEESSQSFLPTPTPPQHTKPVNMSWKNSSSSISS